MDEKELMKDDMVTKLAILLIEEGKTQTKSPAYFPSIVPLTSPV